jgi:hypothetical protein
MMLGAPQLFDCNLMKGKRAIFRAMLVGPPGDALIQQIWLPRHASSYIWLAACPDMSLMGTNVHCLRDSDSEIVFDCNLLMLTELLCPISIFGSMRRCTTDTTDFNLQQFIAARTECSLLCLPANQ